MNSLDFKNLDNSYYWSPFFVGRFLLPVFHLYYAFLCLHICVVCIHVCVGVFCVWWMSSSLYLSVYVPEGRDGETKRGPS